MCAPSKAFLGGELMVVHLKWKCTGTPIVAVKDYPTSYKVKDKFDEVHTQCNCILLITVKKAEEQVREAVKEERGYVDLFGDSNQSQMSGYSPPSPPPRPKKGCVPRIGDARKRAGTGWMTTTAEGTTTMVTAITVGGKGEQRRTMTIVVETVVGGKGERRIRFIS
jgi:hypothetical protein